MATAMVQPRPPRAAPPQGRPRPPPPPGRPRPLAGRPPPPPIGRPKPPPQPPGSRPSAPRPPSVAGSKRPPPPVPQVQILKKRTASLSIMAPVVLRDVTAYQKKHQVGQGTYGYVLRTLRSCERFCWLYLVLTD